jgi:predicted MFS family arabinose efflux permease
MKAAPTVRSLRALDALNFFLADVREGIGPFFAVYLAATLRWNPAQVGFAIALGGIAGVLAQTPMGALADHVRQKRLLIVIASAVIALGSLVTILIGTKTAIFSAQIAMQIAAAVYSPTVAAITLGLVGYRQMDRRTGRNGTFDHAGNVAGALFAGWLGSALGPNAIFYFAVVMSFVNSLAALAIRERDIDHDLARGALDGNAPHVARVGELLRNRNLAVFALAVVLFHFANAAMLPLVGQFLAIGERRGAPLDMAACIIVAQVVMTPVALLAGKFAHTWGRKPILLIGFLALPIRGVLYTLSRDPRYLLAVQMFDGIGAGVFGVVSVIVVADITRGTGRFNLAQGAIATATGIGAAMSNALTGVVAKNFGYNAGFLFLAAIAVVALVFFAFAMPETIQKSESRDSDSKCLNFILSRFQSA